MELQEIGFRSLFTLNDLGERSDSQPEEIQGSEPLVDNLWHFPSHIWGKVKENFSTVEELYAAIRDIHDELSALKEEYRDQSIDFSGFDLEFNRNGGVSSTYFLYDEAGVPQYVVKPLDEDGGALNSRNYISPFHDSPYRKNMPLYRISMREVAAYRLAQKMGMGQIVPKTELSLLESPMFHDLFESIRPEERQRYLDFCGEIDKEKLCSVQEFVPNSKSLFEALHEFQMAKMTPEEIATHFDQQDFEEANILIWTTYDTDAHSSNILVYPKGVDAMGNEILGIKKIDNGLAFPDKNENLRNSLIHMKNAERELSASAKAKILAIDVDGLVDELEQLGLESAGGAMKERISLLKELAQREHMTMKQINTELSKIGKK